MLGSCVAAPRFRSLVDATKAMQSLDNMDIVGQQIRIQLAAIEANPQVLVAAAEPVQERLDADAGAKLKSQHWPGRLLHRVCTSILDAARLPCRCVHSCTCASHVHRTTIKDRCGHPSSAFCRTDAGVAMGSVL